MKVVTSPKWIRCIVYENQMFRRYEKCDSQNSHEQYEFFKRKENRRYLCTILASAKFERIMNENYSRLVQHSVAKKIVHPRKTRNCSLVWSFHLEAENGPIISRITPAFLGSKLPLFWIKNNPFRMGTHTAGFPRRRVLHPVTGQTGQTPWFPTLSLFLSPLRIPFRRYRVLSVATLSWGL